MRDLISDSNFVDVDLCLSFELVSQVFASALLVHFDAEYWSFLMLLIKRLEPQGYVLFHLNLVITLPILAQN